MNKSTKYAENGAICRDMYVKNEMTLQDVSQKTGIHFNTLSRWKKQYKWDEQRETLRGSTPEILNVLEDEIKTLLVKLKTADEETKSGIIDKLAKLNKITGNQ